MPPHRPEKLSAFLGKIVRNLALNLYKRYTAEKRGNGQVPIALNELKDCIPATGSETETIDDLILIDMINRFLAGLPAEKRKIFVRRYWYLSSVKEIAEDYSISESKVKVTLLRVRNDLRQVLEKEGVSL